MSEQITVSSTNWLFAKQALKDLEDRLARYDEMYIEDRLRELEGKMAELKVFHNWLKSVENLEVTVTQKSDG